MTPTCYWPETALRVLSRYETDTPSPRPPLGREQLATEEAMQERNDEALLTPSEVASMFRVNPKTVARWARAGKISAIRTLGGHRRFRASEIRNYLEQVESEQGL